MLISFLFLLFFCSSSINSSRVLSTSQYELKCEKELVIRFFILLFYLFACLQRVFVPATDSH